MTAISKFVGGGHKISCIMLPERLSITQYYLIAFWCNLSFTVIFTCIAAVTCGQVFEGNVDSYTVKHYYLDDAVLARYIKFHTVQWHRHPSMRVEVIGCQGQSHRFLANLCVSHSLLFYVGGVAQS